MTNAVTIAQGGSLGNVTGFKNRLINGDFRIWQRGTSVTYTGGSYTADMWAIEPRSSQSVTISQSTDVPIGEGHGFSGRFTATGGALQGFHIRTGIENPAAGNYGEFQAGSIWTLSLWAKSAYSTAITPIIFLTSNVLSNPNSSVGVNAGTQTIASTWTKYSWTVTMPSWVVDSGSLSLCNNLTIRLLVGAGAQDLYITGAQMEPGTVATQFDRRHIQNEIALCQRYYQVFQKPHGRGVFNGPTSANRIVTPLMVQMRAAPSISISGVFDWYDGTTTGTINSFSQQWSTVNAIEFDTVVSAGSATTGRPVVLYNGGNTGSLIATAEL